MRENGYLSKKKGGWTSSSISKIMQNTIYVKADDILYDYLAADHIKFLNDRSMWNGEHSAHIVGKKPGNANVRNYETLENTSVYITNFSGIIDSRTYISVMNRLRKNEAFSSCTKASRLQELSGKLKCTCGYSIKAYSVSTNGKPYLGCHANRVLKTCNHKYNGFNFYDIQEEVGKQIQARLDNLHNLFKEKERKKLVKKKKIKELEKQLTNLVQMASMSDEVRQATVKPIEDVQKKLNTLRLDLKLNFDKGDELQIPELTYNGIALEKYSVLNSEQKKYVVSVLIDKIVLHEEGEEIEIIWKE